MKKSKIIIILLTLTSFSFFSAKPTADIYTFDNLPPEMHYLLFQELINDAKTFYELQEDIIRYSKISKKFNKLTHEKRGLNIIESKKHLLLTEKDKNGNTPLHLAAQNLDVQEVADLLNMGADPNAKNNLDDVPLQSALSAFGRKSYHDKEIFGKQTYEITKLLFEHGTLVTGNIKLAKSDLKKALKRRNAPDTQEINDIIELIREYRDKQNA